VNSIYEATTTRKAEPLVERAAIITEAATLRMKYVQTILRQRKPYVQEVAVPKIEFKLANGADVTALMSALGI
jgi:hypothetical protein